MRAVHSQNCYCASQSDSRRSVTCKTIDALVVDYTCMSQLFFKHTCWLVVRAQFYEFTTRNRRVHTIATSMGRRKLPKINEKKAIKLNSNLKHHKERRLGGLRRKIAVKKPRLAQISPKSVRANTLCSNLHTRCSFLI